MPTKKRTLFLGTAAVLLVLAAAVLPDLFHTPSTLLKRARKVAAVGQWDSKQDNYFWLSDQEVLLVTPGNALTEPNSPPVIVRRVNTVNGIAREDSILEAMMRGHSNNSIADWQLSPDAKWLLSYDYANSWAATSLDGHRQILRPYQAAGTNNGGSFVAWSPDSRSWVQARQVEFTTHNYFYQLSTPLVTDHSGHFGLDGLQVVGLYGPTRLLALLPRTGDGGGISMADYDVLHPSTSSHFYSQHVPPNMDVQEVTLSPDHSHLAWKFTVKPLPLGLEATINSSYVRHSSPATAGLWVSDLSCNNLREIGTLDIRDDHITNLRWTPDGKRLSFINGDALYTVPVN